MPLPTFAVTHRKRKLSQQSRRQSFLGQHRRSTRLWGELLEPRLMMAVDTPDIVVGRTLSAYSIADVQNNQLKITYSVYNQEAEDVSGVLLTTTLQAGVSLVEATELPDQNGQELAWSFGTLPAYGRASVEVTVSLANGSILTLDDGAEAFSTLNARASSDTTPAAVLNANPLPAALLASTVDANTTDPFIQEQAARLDYNAQNIIDYLQDEVGYESYTGSLRGARGTLWSSAGNALDEASLGVALFRASGIPAQYAAGILPDPLARQLILSMFPATHQSLGALPAGSTVSNPLLDTQLLTEARSHYWIRFESGGVLQDIDTTIAGAGIGQTFAAPSGPFDQVPEALRHKTTISLEVESYSQASAAFGFSNGLSSREVLTQTFATAALVGRPVTLGHLVSENNIPSPIFSSKTLTYTPYLRAGDLAFDSLNDHVTSGSAYQEVFTNFPLGSQLVTGVFLSIDTTSPAGSSEHFERALVDKVGFAIRQGLGGGSISVDPNGPATITAYDLTTINLAPGRQHPLALERSVQETSRLQSEANDLSAQQAGLNISAGSAGSELMLEILAASNLLRIHQFLASSQAFIDDQVDNFLVAAYQAEPRITLATTKAVTVGDAVNIAQGIDLRSNSLRIIAAPGQAVEATIAFELMRGSADSFFEASVMGSGASAGQMVPLSADEVVRLAEAQQIPLIALGPNDLAVLETLALSTEAKARISIALRAGQAVVVPERSVLFHGEPRSAWYQIDLQTGATLGVTDDGGHQAIIEYVKAIGIGFGLGFSVTFFTEGVSFFCTKNHIPDPIGWGITTFSNAQAIVAFTANPANRFVPLGALLFGFALGFGAAQALSGIIVQPALKKIFPDPPLPGIQLGAGIATARIQNTLQAEVVATATLPGGVALGNLQAANQRIAGDLAVTWQTSAAVQTIFSATELSADGATIELANGTPVGTGNVRWSSISVLPIAQRDSATVDLQGQGELATYATPTSGLGLSGDWQNYSAALSGNVDLLLTTAALTLNGTALPAGTYRVRSSQARLGGEGSLSASTFANTATVTAGNGVVQIGPAAGTFTLGGQPVAVNQGVTLQGFQGTLTLGAGASVDALVLSGSAANLLGLIITPTSISTDQNNPATIALDYESTLTGTLELEVAAPAGWQVKLENGNQLRITPAAGLQNGTFPVRIVARSQSNPDLVAAADVLVTVTPTTPGLAFDVAADSTFTVPFQGAQVPTSFRATMQNLGRATDTYDLTFPNPPAGFNILRSVNSVTVPAGETGITGIYLEPNGVLAAPGTSISFTVTATSTSDPLITQSETITFQMPAVAAVTVESDPPAVNTTPGAPVSANVTIKNVGNVLYNLAVGAELPNGLAIAGLTTPVALAVGQTTIQVVTFTPAVGTPLNSTLTPTLTYGPAVAINTAAVVQVDLSAPQVEAGQAVQVSAEIVAAVLQSQQGSAAFVVRNSVGSVVFSSTAVPLPLRPVMAAQQVALGVVNTAGFAPGEYTVEVTLRDGTAALIPGALGLGEFVVGLPVSVSQNVSPQILTQGLELAWVTGNATTNNSLTVGTQPLVSLLETNGTALNVAVFNNLAYVAGTNDVTIIDLANPANPQVVGTFGSSVLTQDGFSIVQIVGTQLIVGSLATVNATGTKLLVYSLANPLSPQLVSNTTVPYRFLSDLFVQGSAAFLPMRGISFTMPGDIVDQSGDFVAVDLTNPANPTVADVLFNDRGEPVGSSHFENGGTLVNSQLAYLGSTTAAGTTTQGEGRVHVVNIANPSNLSLVREVAIPGMVQVLDIAIQGNRALVIGSSQGSRNPFNGFDDIGLEGNLTLAMLDITDPTNPVLIGTSHQTQAVFPKGNAPSLLQAMSLGNGSFAVGGVKAPGRGPVLLVIDADDPANLSTHQLATPALVNGLSVSGGFLHATSAAGLATYRIDALTETTVEVAVQVPTGTGVAVVGDSFNVAPSQIVPGVGFNTLVWNVALDAEHPTQELTWQTSITGLPPGSVRNLTLGGSVDITTDSGVNLDLTLPAQTVATIPATQTLQIPVRVVVPGSDAIASAAIAAAQLGKPDLSNRLSDLSTALTNLFQNPTSLVFHSQAVAALNSVIGQLAADCFLAPLIPALTANRDALVLATTPAQINAATVALGATLQILNQRLTSERLHGFEFALGANTATVIPGVPATLPIFLQNTGTAPTTYDLTLGTLPVGFTGRYMRNGNPITSVLLQADEVVTFGINGISLEITPVGNEVFPFGVSATVTAREAPVLTCTAQAAISVRPEFVQVVTVLATPPFTTAGAMVAVSAQISNAVNRPQQVFATYVVKNSGGATVFTSFAAAITLGVQTSLITANLGSFDSTGFTNGEYVIEVTLRDAASAVIPGGTATGRVLIGLPVSATITATPATLPAGNGVVTNTLTVSSTSLLPAPLTPLSVAPTTLIPTTVAVNGTIAYVGGTNGVDIVNVADPTHPIIVGTFAANLIVQGGFTAVRVVNANTLLVTTTTTLNANGFQLLVYNTTNPVAPALVSSTTIPNFFINDMLLQGNTVIVPTGVISSYSGGDIFFQGGNVVAIDVTNPAAPVRTDTLTSGDGPNSISGGDVANANTVYVGTSTSTGGNTHTGIGQVQIVDTATPANLQTLSRLNIPGTNRILDVSVQGNRALVVGSTRGFRNPFGGFDNFGLEGTLTLSMLDITDRRNPVVIGNTLATNATFSQGLTPVELSAVPMGNGRFAVSGVFVDGLPVLMLVDPADPVNIAAATFSVPALASEMTVVGDLLYSAGQNGLNIYRIGDFIATPYTASVRVPNNTGVAVVAGSFNIAPNQIIAGADYNTLVWNRTLAFGQSQQVFTWQSTVANLTSAQLRDVTVGTQIDAVAGGTPLTLTLPETSVAAANILGLTPATRTAPAGTAASYVVTVSNPTASAVLYNLAVQGMASNWVSLPATVNVPALSSVNVNLQLTPEQFAALSNYGFVVTAQSAAGARGSAEGVLTVVAGQRDAEAHGVVAALSPLTATAGQGTPATFTLRVTNTGSATDTFNLAATLPPGFTAAFEQTSVVVPPGASNFREITVQVTPPLGTAAATFPISVRATSATLPAITNSAGGNVSVVTAGVDVSLNPSAGTPGSTFQLTVRNTGTVQDTFDLVLAGPGALVSTLATSSVTLAPGASQVVNVTVAAIDFAVRPSLELSAIATSRNNSAIRDLATSQIVIPLTMAMTSEFEEDTITLTAPGSGTFLLLIDNLGNGEDAYTATITTTSGPITAALIGLGGTAVQTVPIFRLPGLSTGAIVLNANLAAIGQGTITVQVRSLTNDSIVSQSIATLRSATTDFGDAPDSYGTLLISNGARHDAIGPRLGTYRDSEVDGQPTALGDDNLGVPDDEDGVVLPGILVAGTCDCSGTGLGSSIVVTASAPAYLDAWIDFNRDGDFDSNERIANSVPMLTGANTLNVSIPATVSNGPSYARFRLSSAGGRGPTGPAADGEVEDYAVQIFNPTFGSGTIIVDPRNANAHILYVKGTVNSDAIVVRQTSPGFVTVYIAPTVSIGTFSLASFDRIVICALTGNDSIAVEAPITKPTVIYGDEGNDAISGGSGPDIIFGGAGIDSIAGGLGDDTISGGADNDTVSGDAGFDRLVEFGSGTFTLTSTQFKVGAETNYLGYFEAATLIGGASSDSFNLGGWSLPASVDGGGGTNTIIDSGNANFVLTETSLARTIGSATRTIMMSGIQNANLTGGTSNNTFNLTAWPHAATLSGGTGIDLFTASGDGDFTLSDVTLLRPNQGMLRLSGFENATLTGNSSSNAFNVSGWSQAATLNAGSGIDKLIAAGNVNFTLTNTQLTRSTGGAFTLSGFESAELTGGTGNNTLSAATFSGQVKLDGGAGNDTLTSGSGIALLLGGAGKDTLRAGTGRSLMIGGLGLDRLTGGSNEDLLVDGTTAHDNNALALAMLLAEWASASSYTDRVAHLTGTPGGLNGNTTHLGDSNVLHDTAVDILLGGNGNDLFFAKLSNPAKDTLSDKTLSETAI